MLNTNITPKKAYIAWASVVIFYFYQYVLRVFPNIMAHQIRDDLHMNAEQFSLIGSWCLYSYALFQIPIGIFTDKIGIKKIIIWSIILCVLSTYMVTITENHYLIYLSRFLTGAGSASALMVALKIISDYIPAGKRGFLMGATLTIGSIGPVIGANVFYSFIESHSWRESLLIIDFSGLILLMIVFFCIPEDSKKLEKCTIEELKTIWVSIKEIFANKTIIYYSVMAIALYAPFAVLADLWGTDFVMTKYKFNHKDASSASTFLYIGLGLGCLFFPWISEKYNKIDFGIKITLLGLLASFVILLYGPKLSVCYVMLILFAIGMFSGGEMICFTGASMHTNSKNSGLTIGVVNTFNMLGAAIAEQIVGHIYDVKWSGKLSGNGNRLYSSEDSIFSFTFLVILIGMCTMIALFKRKRL